MEKERYAGRRTGLYKCALAGFVAGMLLSNARGYNDTMRMIRGGASLQDAYRINALTRETATYEFPQLGLLDYALRGIGEEIAYFQGMKEEDIETRALSHRR